MAQDISPSVRVRWLDPERADDAAVEAVLSPDERERADRYVAEHAAAEFRAGRWLLRTELSRRFPDTPPSQWRFRANRWGKLELETPVPAPVSFNLSHSRGLAAVAIGTGMALGVDVEQLSRRVDHLGVGETVFSGVELEGLRALGGEAQRRRFFDLWTLKESYIKARGMGLSLPLKPITFALEPSGLRGLTLGEELHDDPRRWRFWMREPTSDHKLALCVHLEDEREPAVSFAEAEPP